MDFHSSWKCRCWIRQNCMLQVHIRIHRLRQDFSNHSKWRLLNNFDTVVCLFTVEQSCFCKWWFGKAIWYLNVFLVKHFTLRMFPILFSGRHMWRKFDRFRNKLGNRLITMDDNSTWNSFSWIWCYKMLQVYLRNNKFWSNFSSQIICWLLVCFVNEDNYNTIE